MAYVKLTADSPARFRVAGVTFDEDNRVHELSDELADLLVERRGGFERVDASALDDEEADADDTGDTGLPTDVSETGIGTIETEDVTAEERAPDYDGVETEVVGEDGEPAAEAADQADVDTDQADTEDAADTDAEAAAEDEYDADAADEYDAEDEDEYEAGTRDAQAADAEAADAPLDPDEYTIDELETELADGDYSADELDALAAAERDGQDRTGATDAIDRERGE